MRIEQLSIDGFGRWAGVEFGPFDPSLTVIHGPNEAGKSTLHAFIRAILFGFPRRSSRDWIPPLAGGRHGGRITLLDREGRRYLVERHSDECRGEAGLTLPDGQEAGDEVLRSLLGGATGDVYRAVFAFGIDELQSLDSLPASEVSSRIYAAGYGAGRLPEAMADFERRAAEIFLPRGRNQPVAKLLDELNEVEQLLAASRAEATTYHEIREQRRQLDAEIERIEAEAAVLERFRRKRAMSEARIREAQQRVERYQLDLAEAEQAARDLISRRRLHATGSLDEPDLAMRQRRIDEAREAWARFGAARRMIDEYSSAHRRRSFPGSQRAALLLGLATLLPLAFGVLTGSGVGLVAGSLATSLAALTLLIALLARARYESVHHQALRQIESTRRAAEAQFLHAAELAGIDPRDPEAGIARAEAEIGHARQSAGLEDRLREARQIVNLRRQRLEAAEADLEKIRGEHEADEADWLEYLSRFSCLSSAAIDLDVACANLQSARSSRLVERGRLDEQMRRLSTETRGGELRARRAALLAGLRENAREWALHTISGTLLRQAQRTYEEERQPAVVRAAEAAFGAITNGSYDRIVFAMDGARSVHVLSRDGRRQQVDELSRGAREQLYLSLRLGLIREFGERACPLPVLLDDILVNFDPGRARATVQALLDLSGRHQLVVFTCHPATVELMQSSTRCRIIEIDRSHQRQAAVAIAG